MMLIGQPLTAREAKESGILTRVVSRDKLDEEVEKVAEIVAKKPLDGIVMGKKEFGLAMDVMGLSTGYDLGSFAHTLVSNMKFEPGEFNLMKELRDKGRKGMYAERCPLQRNAIAEGMRVVGFSGR
jgi:enoyl-CoA hydratase